ncbi:MAG: hypothetical protein IPK84_02700 [Candidatus Moraniibacteriota bacterium]|nr:MAG: hypothetical protein IPK84_02700 [Candidatus Moranbacteria bacterium]
MKTTTSKSYLFAFLVALALTISACSRAEEHIFKAEEAPLWLKVEGPLSADAFFAGTIVHISVNGADFHNMEVLRVEASHQDFEKSPSFIDRVVIDLVNWHDGARYTLYFATLHFNREPTMASRFNSVSFKGYPDCPDGICSLKEIQTRHRVSF